MPSPFENLSGPGKPLKAEPADAKEFAGLKRAGMARLQDASNTALALDPLQPTIGTPRGRDEGASASSGTSEAHLRTWTHREARKRKNLRAE